MFAAIDYTDFTLWLSDPKHLFDAISFVLGLLYLYFEFKASIWLWPVGIIMPIVHAVTYYKAGLYADFGMEFFYVMVAVYGFAKWRMGKSGDAHKNSVPITHVPQKMMLVALVVLVAAWGGLYIFLSRCTDSTVPVLDAFTTALSIVAYWALAHKWVEQWLLWLVVDAVSAALYFRKGIPFSATLYGFYTIMAVLGYRNWVRLMKAQPERPRV